MNNYIYIIITAIPTLVSTYSCLYRLMDLALVVITITLLYAKLSLVANLPLDILLACVVAFIICKDCDHLSCRLDIV